MGRYTSCKVCPLFYDDWDALSSINYAWNEARVEPTDIKTYGCLHLILDDLQTLLNIWKKRTQLLVFQGHEAVKDNDRESKAFLLENRPDGKLYLAYDRTFGRDCRDDLELVTESCKDFQSLFKSCNDCDGLIGTINDMKGCILRQIVPYLNDLLSQNKPCQAPEAERKSGGRGKRGVGELERGGGGGT